ncbi:bacitracin ABC transporter ATP-binding protein, partial [Bacillus thuringiensis]
QLYNEIYYGDNRKVFYQKILEVLALLGGNANDFSTVRI